MLENCGVRGRVYAYQPARCLPPLAHSAFDKRYPTVIFLKWLAHEPTSVGRGRCSHFYRREH